MASESWLGVSEAGNKHPRSARSKELARSTDVMMLYDVMSWCAMPNRQSRRVLEEGSTIAGSLCSLLVICTLAGADVIKVGMRE